MVIHRSKEKKEKEKKVHADQSSNHNRAFTGNCF